MDGIQNLHELTRLNIFGNPGITDLTPLLGLDRLETVEISEDMQEALSSLEEKEYSFEIS